VPQCISHRLHKHELFTNEALADLIDRYPREHYSLVEWGEHDRSRGQWREGDIGGLKGDKVIEAIGKSRVWINLRNTPVVDNRYKDLLDRIFGELESAMPGFRPEVRSLGILISSPLSRTLYHCDLPGQSLWQIRGRKRVYVYPKTAPFVRPEHLETIALSGVEVNMPYEPWYDDHAQVYDIEPGQMLQWPLNAPHRVDNEDCLNVSMTMEYFDEHVRRTHMVTVANGIMRSKLGLNPTGHSIRGPAFLAKAVLQKTRRNAPFVKKENRPRRPVTFRLDLAKPNAISNIAEASS